MVRRGCPDGLCLDFNAELEPLQDRGHFCSSDLQPQPAFGIVRGDLHDRVLCWQGIVIHQAWGNDAPTPAAHEFQAAQHTSVAQCRMNAAREPVGGFGTHPLGAKCLADVDEIPGSPFQQNVSCLGVDF